MNIVKTKDSTPVNKKLKPTVSTFNFKETCDKAVHVLIVTACEAALTALAIQGMLSLIHTAKELQIVLSVGFVAALLIIRFRSK